MVAMVAKLSLDHGIACLGGLNPPKSTVSSPESRLVHKVNQFREGARLTVSSQKLTTTPKFQVAA
jgi:hypothetical protein